MRLPHIKFRKGGFKHVGGGAPASPAAAPPKSSQPTCSIPLPPPAAAAARAPVAPPPPVVSADEAIIERYARKPVSNIEMGYVNSGGIDVRRDKTKKKR